MQANVRASASSRPSVTFGPGAIQIDARGARQEIDIEGAVLAGVRKALAEIGLELGAVT